MSHSPIFSSADILLPELSVKDDLWRAWSVIACDQFTSDLSYWAEVERVVGSSPSVLFRILPEAYLGTDREEPWKETVRKTMEKADEGMKRYPDSFVYLKRTLPDGTVRSGIVGKIDLEAYDYAKDSVSPVRATEATVTERIPPRQAIRRAAPVEIPHILILMDDPENKVFSLLDGISPRCPVLYDFDLMLGGGHVLGRQVSGREKDLLEEALSSYEASREGSVVYAMGDGNHSLAAAKAHYEALKRELGPEARNHPARYALCEVVSLQDPSLVFEPIFRLIKNADTEDFLREFSHLTAEGEGEQTVEVLWQGNRKTVHFLSPSHRLTVGSLQDALDSYLKSHPGTLCDYIHDTDALSGLSEEKGNIGFLLDGMDKGDLFPYVSAYGVLPRKTFSMGEARSKRYYLEMRKIVL